MKFPFADGGHADNLSVFREECKIRFYTLSNIALSKYALLADLRLVSCNAYTNWNPLQINKIGISMFSVREFFQQQLGANRFSAFIDYICCLPLDAPKATVFDSPAVS